VRSVPLSLLSVSFTLLSNLPQCQSWTSEYFVKPPELLSSTCSGLIDAYRCDCRSYLGTFIQLTENMGHLRRPLTDFLGHAMLLMGISGLNEYPFSVREWRRASLDCGHKPTRTPSRQCSYCCFESENSFVVIKELVTHKILARNHELAGIASTVVQLEDRFNKRYHYPYVFLNDVPFDEGFKAFAKLFTTLPSHIYNESIQENNRPHRRQCSIRACTTGSMEPTRVDQRNPCSCSA
jgi:hypothetical protein